jgi:hypothetical protein
MKTDDTITWRDILLPDVITQLEDQHHEATRAEREAAEVKATVDRAETEYELNGTYQWETFEAAKKALRTYSDVDGNMEVTSENHPQRTGKPKAKTQIVGSRKSKKVPHESKGNKKKGGPARHSSEDTDA